MTDEEYARANWEWVREFEGHPRIHTPDHPFLRVFMNWAAAAEFTRERMEQIRQLEADIEWARGMSNTPEEVLLMGKLNTSEVAVVWTKNLHASCRTIARLESALADLKRGMKA